MHMDGKAHIHDIQQRGEVSTFGCNGPELSRKELQNESCLVTILVKPNERSDVDDDLVLAALLTPFVCRIQTV